MDNFKNILEKYFNIPFYFKVLGFAVIWLIIAVILYFAIISLQLQKIDKKSIELAKLKKQTLEIVKVKKKLKTFEKELKELERNFKIALKKLPDSKEIPKLLFDISDYGKKNNLDFLFFKPGKVEKKEFFGRIPIKVKISGMYHNVGQFLYDIANMPRIVKVPDFSLTPMKNGILILDGNIETYVFLKEKLNAKKKKHKKPKKKK